MSSASLIINDAYLPLVEDKKRYQVLKGSAGSGKSVFLSQMAITRLVSADYQNYSIVVIRKTAATLHDSVYKELKNVANDLGIAPALKFTVNPLAIKYGSNEIIFKGLDDVEKMKSISRPDLIWIEEASEVSFDDFTQLDIRLRGDKDFYQMWLSFNPVDRRHWLRTAFFDDSTEIGRELIPKATTLETTYKDNKFLNEEYIESLERLKYTNPRKYMIYALGEWGSDPEGLIYPYYKTYEEEPEDYEIMFYGLDFGFNDPTVLVQVKIKGDDCYVREMFYEKGHTASSLARKMNSLKLRKSLPIYADSAVPDKILVLRREGWNVRKSNKNIEQGIDTVKSFNLYIHVNSYNGLREFANYSWKKDRFGHHTDTPIDSDNHFCDALRYGVHTHCARGIPKIFFPK